MKFAGVSKKLLKEYEKMKREFFEEEREDNIKKFRRDVVLKLYKTCKLTQREIAEVVGVTEAAISQIIKKAKLKT